MRSMNNEKTNCVVNMNPESMQFIEKIARFYEAYGIPRIGGRIFALFLLSATPLSAEKIAQLLSASRGSISTNIRGLISNGWVEKVTFAGDRIEYFQFSPLAWEHVLENRLRGLEPLRKIANQGLAALEKDDPARDQLVGMITWVDLQITSHKEMIANLKNIQFSKNTNSSAENFENSPK